MTRDAGGRDAWRRRQTVRGVAREGGAGLVGAVTVVRQLDA